MAGLGRNLQRCLFIWIALVVGSAHGQEGRQGIETECSQDYLSCTEGLNGVIRCVADKIPTNLCCSLALRLDRCVEPLGESGGSCEGVGTVDLDVADQLLAICDEAPANADQIGAVLPGIRLPESIQITEECQTSFDSCKAIDVRNCGEECCARTRERIACYEDKVAACDNDELSSALEGVGGAVEDAESMVCGALTESPKPSETPAVDPTTDPMSTATPSETPDDSSTSSPAASSMEESGEPSPTETSSESSSTSASPSPTTEPIFSEEECARAIELCATRLPIDLVCNNGGRDCCNILDERQECKVAIDSRECQGREEQSEAGLFEDTAQLEDCSGVCFPASATVQLESGGQKRMDELQIGDGVLSGTGQFQSVFFFSHKLPAKRSIFIEVETAASATIRLSPSHLIPTARGETIPARELVAGRDAVFVLSSSSVGNSSSRAFTPSTVTNTRRVVGVGLFNPHTEARATATVVVNGVVASQYTTAVERTVAALVLRPLQLLFSLSGVSIPLPVWANKAAVYLPAVSLGRL